VTNTTGRSADAPNFASDHEQKRVALGYLQEAWAEARLDGIDGDCLAQACLFAALAEFVSTYGEDAAAINLSLGFTSPCERRVITSAWTRDRRLGTPRGET